jgi:putative spermidine/putrescine transport system permease protein
MSATTEPAPAIPLTQRLAARGIDGLTLLVIPAALFLILTFVYPFLYGLLLSFHPKLGGVLANYVTFFGSPSP